MEPLMVLIMEPLTRLFMQPFSSAGHRIHGHHDYGTIWPLGGLHVAPSLHVDYVEGLEDLSGGTSPQVGPPVALQVGLGWG